MKTIYKSMFMIAVLSLAACGNNATSNNNNENNPKDDMTSMEDMSNDMDPKEDMEDMTCQPKTMCDAEVCGMIDDGCGGMLDCGAPKTCAEINVCGTHDDGCGSTVDCGQCLCENGQPTQPTCDACGVFALTCNGDQSSCAGAPIEAVRNLTENDCASALLYVDDMANGGDGSKNSPFSSLQDALNKAKNGSVKAILIKGTGTYKGTIDVLSGVSILGGFDSSWKPDENLKPTIEGDANPNGDVFGVKADSIDQETWLVNLIVKTPDAVNGHNNYGLYTTKATRLHVYKTDVFAGKGGDGADGQDGASGANGGIGRMGGDGRGKWLAQSMMWREIWVANTLTNFGENPSCPNATAGGRGGAGGYWGPNGEVSPQNGRDSSGGAVGGNGGQTPFTTSGEPGDNGMAFSERATAGPSGQPSGFFKNGFFERENANGQKGADGQNGAGGGGGGGGQYADLDFIGWLVGSPQGGGGGAGGCGGLGAEGGQGGGSSFGLFAVESDGLIATNSLFSGSQGGGGGAGGQGGAGGVGGQGGPSNDTNTDQNGREAIRAKSSGKGGNGADGQGGGHGGGGAGGLSYGAYCHLTVIVNNSSQFAGGLPSQGGSSPSGQNAPGGTATKQQNCL